MKKSLICIFVILLTLCITLDFALAIESVRVVRGTKRIGCLIESDLNGNIQTTNLVRFTRLSSEEFRINAFLNFRRFIVRATRRGRNRTARDIRRCRRAQPDRTGGNGSVGANPGGSSPGGGDSGEGSGEMGSGNENMPPEDTTPCGVAGDLGTVPDLDEIQTRIINGVQCSIGDSPVVEIFMNFSNIPIAVCTGTVVNSRLVVFAAHCLSELGVTVDSVTIIPGGDEMLSITTSNIAFSSAFDFTADGVPGNDDIAVAVTDSDIPTRTVNMLKENDISIGETVIIAGYGNQDSDSDPGFDSGGRDGNLHAGTMTVASVSEEEVISVFNFADNTTPGENSTTCVGDSGGPMFLYRDGEWVLAAITSYGGATCGPEDIAGFANITDPALQSFLEPFL